MFDEKRHEERIEFLRKEIKEEDGTEMNEESVMDFWYWIEMTKTEKKCSLFAIVDTLRAVWQGEAGDDLVGLQFKGGKDVRYVIFKTRYDGKRTQRNWTCGISPDEEASERLKVGLPVKGRRI